MIYTSTVDVLTMELLDFYLQDRRAKRDAGHSPNDRVGDGLKEEVTVSVSVDDGKLENGMCANETRSNPQIEKQ